MAEIAVSDFRRILPYPAGRGNHGGKNGGGGVARSMSREQSFECFGPDERRIAGKHDGKFGVSQRAARYLHGVTGAVLRLLQRRRRPPNGATVAVTSSAWWPTTAMVFLAPSGDAGADDLFNQRSPAGAMQHFCEAGFQSGAFTGGENDYGKIFVFHGIEAQFVGAGQIWQCGEMGLAANY